MFLARKFGVHLPKSDQSIHINNNFPFCQPKYLGNISPRTAVAYIFLSSAQREAIKPHIFKQTNQNLYFKMGGVAYERLLIGY